MPEQKNVGRIRDKGVVIDAVFTDRRRDPAASEIQVQKTEAEAPPLVAEVQQHSGTIACAHSEGTNDGSREASSSRTGQPSRCPSGRRRWAAGM